MISFSYPLQNLFLSLLICFGIQAFFFFFAALFKTDKVTDLSYGATFILLTLYLFFKNITYSFAQLMIVWAIAAWGARLVGYLFNRILKIKKDQRFDGIREDFKKFARFWLFQGLTVWIVMAPFTLALTSKMSRPVGFSDWLGLIIWGLGLTIETVADHQKFVFKNNPKNKNKWIETGIWKYSRHPNYFGEMLCWWGLFIVAIPFLNNWQWLSVVGPIFITFLLLFVSGIPLLEKKYNQRFAEDKAYQAYKNRTSLLVPLPPIKGSVAK